MAQVGLRMAVNNGDHLALVLTSFQPLRTKCSSGVSAMFWHGKYLRRPLTTAIKPQHSRGVSAFACSKISAFMAGDRRITLVSPAPGNEPNGSSSVFAKPQLAAGYPLAANILRFSADLIAVYVVIISAGVATFTAAVLPLTDVGDDLTTRNLLTSQVKLACKLKCHAVPCFARLAVDKPAFIGKTGVWISRSILDKHVELKAVITLCNQRIVALSYCKLLG